MVVRIIVSQISFKICMADGIFIVLFPCDQRIAEQQKNAVNRGPAGALPQGKTIKEAKLGFFQCGQVFI